MQRAFFIVEGTVDYILVILVIFSFPALSYGYVDPGTGHLIWQMMASVIFGAGFFFRKVLFSLRGKKSSKVNATEQIAPIAQKKQ